MKFTTNQIVFFGLVFHLIAAFFSIGYHQCDELFQVIEFAGYKLGINKLENLPWEFSEKMRSGIQPFVVYAFTKCSYFIGIHNPFTIAFFIRFSQSLFSFYVIVKLTQALQQQIKSPEVKKVFWFMAMLLWCLPYFHARFSSENVSTTFFILGLTYIIKSIENKRSINLFLFSGVVLGLSFLIRFQMAFFIFGLLCWLLFIQKIERKNLFTLIVGIVLSLLIGLFFDYWLYDEPILTWWNYLVQNVFNGKASTFGTSPFYFYFTESLLQLIPPFSILLIFSIFYFIYKWRKHLLTWIIVPFILGHLLVPHKELRFLFPLLNFIPFILCTFLDTEFKTTKLNWLSSTMVIRSAMTINTMLLLFFSFKPADETTWALKKIFDLTEGNAPILIYEKSNPYNNQASLNYFRKPNLQTLNTNQFNSYTTQESVYFYLEEFSNNPILIKDNKVYLLLYSNFPSWFKYLNFNGWLQRANCFSIYKLVK